MKMSRNFAIAAPLGGVLVAAVVLVADGTRFSDFTPLTSSAGPTADEAHADHVRQSGLSSSARSPTARRSLAAGAPNTGSLGHEHVNETGPHKGRFLFTVFETGKSGVQRTDLQTGVTDTIWHSPAAGAHVSFDPSLLDAVGHAHHGRGKLVRPRRGCTTSPYGRLFELKNPLDAPRHRQPADRGEQRRRRCSCTRTSIPRTSHEGIQFDKDGNMYFIDELNGGNIYKFTSSGQVRRSARPARPTTSPPARPSCCESATATRRTPPALTPGFRSPMQSGAALPGALTITDVRGVTSVDARNTTDLAAFKGTDYQRPEDMQIQTIDGGEYLYVTTTTHARGLPTRSEAAT